jgi:putative peptidoglycan lipid II flippase
MSPPTDDRRAEPIAAQSGGVSAPSSLRGFRQVGLLTLISRILGMVRDVAMAAVFGAGPVMDAFSVAFRIPNLARKLFGEGAQTTAFLPAFVRTRLREGDDAARDLAAHMFAVLAAVLVVVVGVAEAGLIGCLALGDYTAETRLLLELLCLLFPYLITICLAAQLSAVMHALRQFFWPATVPIVLNLVWLASIPVVFQLVPGDESRMRWLCVAILISGGLQLAVPLLVLRAQGYRQQWGLRGLRPEVGDIIRAMGPILVAVTITQFNTVLDSLLAWGLAPSRHGFWSSFAPWLPVLPDGTASALYFGQRLYQFPLGLIGVGLGTVLFPLLTRHAEHGDQSRLRSDLATGLRLTLAIGLPAGVGLMLLADPITALLFEHGRFAADDRALTSGMIFGYGPGVVGFIGLLIVQRGYYAVGDRMTPLRHGLVAVAINIVLDAVLLWRMGPFGLAWATSLSALAQWGLATLQVQRHTGALPWRQLGVTLVRAGLACGVMAIVCHWTMPQIGSSLGDRLAATLVPLSAGGVAYFVAAALVGLREPWRLVRHGNVSAADDLASRS